MRFTNHHLTPGEAFHLWTRQSGLNEKQIGDMYGVCSRTIRNWEKDRNDHVPNVRQELPDPLPAYTVCYILRRRLGIGVRQFAKTLGVSFQTLSAWENGQFDWHKLAEHFKKQGWDL